MDSSSVAAAEIIEIEPQPRVVKEVLVVYGERRRPVTFSPSDSDCNDRETLSGAVRNLYSDVLGNQPFFLQVESKQWGVIDLAESVPVVNGSTVFVKIGSKEVRNIKSVAHNKLAS